MMTMETKAQQLIASVEALLSNPQASKSAALPSEAYFLNADEIVCLNAVSATRVIPIRRTV